MGGVSRLDAHPEMVGHTMRPGFRINEEIDLSQAAPMTSVINQPRFSGPRTEQADIQQQYNEAIFPEAEAEHHRINAPTPVSTLGVGDPNRQFLEQRLQDMNYEIAQMNATGMDPRTDLQLRNLMQQRMKLMHRIGQRPAPIPGVPLSIEEAGDASMDDPSQMEQLGAQLAHADMMRDDVNPAADVPFQVPPDYTSNFLRRPSTMHQSIFSRAPNRQAYMTRR
jgi:hypothetical protein